MKFKLGPLTTREDKGSTLIITDEKGQHGGAVSLPEQFTKEMFLTRVRACFAAVAQHGATADAVEGAAPEIFTTPTPQQLHVDGAPIGWFPVDLENNPSKLAAHKFENGKWTRLS